MKYFVNVSGGLASAVAADRVLKRFGAQDVDLWFADTLWEDEDLYRFLKDLEAYWGITLNRHTDGRTPLQVAEQRRLIPNSRIAPCSYELKVKPLTAIQNTYPKPLTVCIGLDWRELHRIKAVQLRFDKAATPGVVVDFPLLWKPYEMQRYYDVVSTWGIKPPKAYDLGMSHNNCGGRCVRQGKREWLQLRRTQPQRFQEMVSWEQEQRDKGGARASRSFIQDRRVGRKTDVLTLAELSAESPIGTEETVFTKDDQQACFCNDWEVPELVGKDTD